MSDPPELLTCSQLTARHGPLVVVRGVGLEVGAGEVVALVGPNGAGKTSLLGALMGRVRSTGDVRLRGLAIDGYSTRRRARAGVSLVPDGRGLFPPMSVEENLKLGAHLAAGAASQAARIDRALDLFPDLRSRMKQSAGSLSGGEQQMLAVGKALAGGPSVLLLDEPSQGLAPLVLDTLASAIKELQGDGLGVLLVEQNLAFAGSVASRYVSLAAGQIAGQGPAEALADRERQAAEFLSRDSNVHKTRKTMQ